MRAAIKRVSEQATEQPYTPPSHVQTTTLGRLLESAPRSISAALEALQRFVQLFQETFTRAGR